MKDRPGRDEVLDAYDILIRAEATQLRSALDAVYESGFREGVKAMQKQQMVSGSWDNMPVPIVD